jgi:large subunit ribosomal protein L10
MSKRVKELLGQDIQGRLAGVEACVVADYRGLTANDAVGVRRTLRSQKVRMLVVRNSLARRALVAGPLSSAAPLLTGPSALLWGADDPVSLARVVTEFVGRTPLLKVRGASVEGRTLTAPEVLSLAKLPTRLEMIAGLAARAMGPGQRVSMLAQAPGRGLAGQIRTLAEKSGPPEAEAAAPEAPAPEPAPEPPPAAPATSA